MPRASYYYANKEKCLKESYEWWRKNVDKKMAQTKRRIANNPELKQKYKQNTSASARNWHRNIRLKVLTHYSNGSPKCACCGIEEIIFLCIDHINGGGNKQRKSITKSLPRWLYMNNYPEGYRILCWNCNAAFGLKGYCPHNKIPQGVD